MAANLDWPLIFKRQYAGALDADQVMQDLATLDSYIANSGLAFEGQIVYIKDESAPYKIDDDGAGNLIRNPVDTGSGSISASQISYSLNDSGDWDGSPTQVNTALDELADRLRIHENATGNVHNTTLEQVRSQDNTITGGPIDMGFNGIEKVNFLHADLTGGNQSFQIGNASTTSGGFFFNTKNAADSTSITAFKIDNGDTSLVHFKSGVGVNKVLDEDDLISNDVQALATQQSIKAYVDNNIASSLGILTKKVSLTSTQILNLNSSPVELIATPGVGKFISVQIIYSKFNFNSSAYSSNTDLQFVYNGATTELLQNSAILASTGNSVETPFFNNNSDISPFENVSLLATNLTGDPTGGDGTLDIYLTYTIIDI